MFRTRAAGVRKPVRTRFVRTFLFTLFLVAAVGISMADAGPIGGRVVDPEGRPVAQADVLLLRGSTVVAVATTDSDGRYGPIDVPGGQYDLTVVAPGLRLAPMRVRVAEDAPTHHDLRLTLAAYQEAVVVSAAQIDTTVSRAASSVSVVTSQDVDRLQARSLVDVMAIVPGIAAAPSGTVGAQTSLFPRGGESDYTLVLVDGVPQNGFGGAFDAAHLSLANVERVEVVRGPQSALYGSGAIGGIVHLVTRAGGPPRASLSVEGGGDGTRATTASASAARGPWSFGGGFDWLESEGDGRTFESVGGEVRNDDYTRLVASGSIGWSDSPDRRVRLDVRGGRNERGFPGPYGSDPLGLYGGLDTISRGINRHAAVAASALVRGRGLAHRLQATWSDAWSDYVSPYGTSEDRVDRLTGRYQVDAQAAGIGLSGGAELLRERARNSFITDASFGEIPVERSNLGLFVEARPSLHPRLLVTLGLRSERIERRRLAGDGSRPDFAPSVVWSTNPKLSAAWFLRTGTDGSWLGETTIRASAGTGIKAPTTFDIAFTDNPDLRPERSRSVDVGLEQHIWQSRVRLDATWFRNTYDDLIVAVTQPLAGASRYRTDNIANARSAGLEIGAGWRVAAVLAARASWTWLDTEVLGVDTVPDRAFGFYEVGDPLVRRPRHAGSFELQFTTDRVSALLLVHQRGAMRDLEPNFGSEVVTNPGRAVAALSASVRLARGFELFGRVSNLFDRRYEDVYGFPAAGRRLIVGLRAAAGN